MEHEVMFTKRYSNHSGDGHLRVVLCYLPDADCHRFVVWMENMKDSVRLIEKCEEARHAFYDGSYFATFIEAVEEFNNRGINSVIGVVEL